MCGIAGLLNLRGGTIDEELLRRMTRSLTHRGPDASTVWVRGSGVPVFGGRCSGFGADPNTEYRPSNTDHPSCIGLGHTRLSIIDVAGGDQPIWNEDRSCLVVFNGEIYNFRELRQELEGQGHRFATATDTEVIVHAYEEWGSDCPERLRGMFAFAVWDERAQQLLLARDRMGIKPLHLAWRGDRLAFASEMQALLQDPELDRTVDPSALEAYLALGYVPGPGTILRSVTSLPAGHSLTVEVGKAAPRAQRYWQVPVGTARRRPEAECLRELDELLQDVVGRHLISDVPLGVFLSGGTDSSILTAVAARQSSHPLRTFSIGFPGNAGYNEAPVAREVARRLGTEHRECMLQPDALESLPRLIGLLDQPLADPSAIPLLSLCQMTREHVTVALAGDGGDELFGGYERYYWDRVAHGYAGLPAGLRERVIEPLLLRLPRLPLDVRKDPFRRARKFIRYAALTPSHRYFHWFELMTPECRQEVLDRDGDSTPDDRGPVSPASHFERAFREATGLGASPLDAMQYCDLQTMLRDDLLFKCDRVSMAVSLEARVPFLDHVLIEWAFSLPEDMRVRGRTLKYLLKRWLAQHLPPELVYRRKQGFEVPLYDWLTGAHRGGADDRSRRGGREWLRELLLSNHSLADGQLRPEGVRRLVERLERGERVLALPVYSLAVWELWRRQYLESPAASVRA